METYSQTAQDTIAYKFSTLNSYIEVGAKGPVGRNNTYLLEKNGWTGISFEIDSIHRNVWESSDRDMSRIKFMNAYDFNFNSLDSRVGYLSLDIDSETLNFYKTKIRPSGIKFDVISMEHDAFDNLSKSEEQRRELLSDGYHCYLENICLTKEDTKNQLGPYENIYVSYDVWEKHNLKTLKNLTKNEILKLWR